jgi:hypothetical protein
MPELCKRKAEKSPLSIYLIDELLSMARTSTVGKLWPDEYLVVNPSDFFYGHPRNYVIIHYGLLPYPARRKDSWHGGAASKL